MLVIAWREMRQSDTWDKFNESRATLDVLEKITEFPDALSDMIKEDKEADEQKE